VVVPIEELVMSIIDKVVVIIAAAEGAVATTDIHNKLRGR
jgi:hypothetical protein